jgi:hypothetical protein
MQPAIRAATADHYDDRSGCAEIAESVIREASQDAAIVAL